MARINRAAVKGQSRANNRRRRAPGVGNRIGTRWSARTYRHRANRLMTARKSAAPAESRALEPFDRFPSDAKPTEKLYTDLGGHRVGGAAPLTVHANKAPENIAPKPADHAKKKSKLRNKADQLLNSATAFVGKAIKPLQRVGLFNGAPGLMVFNPNASLANAPKPVLNKQSAEAFQIEGKGQNGTKYILETPGEFQGNIPEALARNEIALSRVSELGHVGLASHNVHFEVFHSSDSYKSGVVDHILTLRIDNTHSGRTMEALQKGLPFVIRTPEQNFRPTETPAGPERLLPGVERLTGDVPVDAKNPHKMDPMSRKLSAEANDLHGEYSGTTYQGVDYKSNEDSILRVTDPQGNLHLIAIDGMGGQGFAQSAMRLTSTAFSVELSRSGDHSKAWNLANNVVRHFNALQKTKLYERLRKLSAKRQNWNHLEQSQLAAQAAEAELKKLLQDPNSKLEAIEGVIKDGSGAAAVSVTITPPKQAHEPHRVHFNWVGDATAMVLRRHNGQWKIVYETVDESFPNEAGQLEAGRDYEPGGLGRRLAGQLHPWANVIMNGVGLSQELKFKQTGDGEIPIPNAIEGTGARPATEFANGMPLKKGDLVLYGSDGWSENFGSELFMLNLIKDAKTAEQALQILTLETHQRMTILAKAKEYFANRKQSHGFRDQFTHQDMTLYIEPKGDVYATADGGKPVDHFKLDNFSLGAYLHNPKVIAKELTPPQQPLQLAVTADTRIPAPAANPVTVQAPQKVLGNPSIFYERNGQSHSRQLDFLESPAIVLGREADVIINAEAVSARHASIWTSKQNGRDVYFIQDGAYDVQGSWINSSNGVWVNGVWLQPGTSRKLQRNDVIHLANQQITWSEPR